VAHVSSGGNFSFEDKFTGFSVSTYSTGNNGFNATGGTYSAPGNSSSSRPLHVYHARNTYNLTFSANYPPAFSASEPDAQVFTNVPFEQPLAAYSTTAAPAAPSSDYFFDGWYEDASGTVPFVFANETMPAANKIIYAKWSLVQYLIHINPNGGVIDHRNSGPSGYSTYFENKATEVIEPYNNLVRPYVEVSDAEAAGMASGTVYRYVYTPLTGLEGGTMGGKLTAEARNAVYIQDTEASLQAYYNFYVEQVRIRNTQRGDTMVPLPRAQWEATYVMPQKYRALRSGESYKFLAWYEVFNGVRQNTPFDFSQPADHETTLIAEWRLDGGYNLLYTTEYYAENNDYITANLNSWVDPQDGNSKYADGTMTQAMQEPVSIMVNGVESDEYQFRGWQIVRVETVAGKPRYTPLEPGVYYTAGQPLKVQARYADENMVIHMQAVYEKRENAYRRPDVISLILDASKDAADVGTGSIDTTNGSWPAWTYPGHYWSDETKIYFGDAQSNTAVHLYKYATTLTESEITGESLSPAGVNFFEHSAGYKLVGFDLDAPDTDFVPTYTADAVVAVTPGEQHTLYAVWEPMVYLTFVNDTGVGPVTFNLNGTGSSMYIVSQMDGSFSRTPLDTSQSITIAEGETIRFVMPYGAGETITVSGTNTLGTGYMLTAKSELGFTSPVARTLTGTLTGTNFDYRTVPNNQDFGFSDILLTDAEGIVITFTAEKAPHTLVLKDNYNGDGTGGDEREISFSEKVSDHTVYFIEENATSYTLPSTSTRLGYEFVGWDENYATTTPTFSVSEGWTIQSLKSFFGAGTNNNAEIKTLYAIWKANADRGVVYIWKDVPEPGNQTKDFTFTVQFTGGFSFQEYTSSWWWGSWNSSTDTMSSSNAYETSIMSGTFTLKHGEYLKITSSKNNDHSNSQRPYLRVIVQKYDTNGNQVGTDAVLSWTWQYYNYDNEGASYRHRYFVFTSLDISVIELDYSTQYETTEDIAAESTDYHLEHDTANRCVTWTSTDAGGTVIYTNTRKTADVTIKKTLLPAEADPESFNFSATLTNGESYELSPSSQSIVSGTGEWVIPGIPTGATLTITENADSGRYTTSAAAVKDADGTSISDGNAEDNIFSFTVTEDSTVTFTNTLKSQNIRLVVMDDDVPANYLDSANFTFPGIFSGTKFSATGTGLVWEGTAFVGSYTLTETSMPDHAGVRYIKLQAPATVNIAGGTGGDNKVTVTTGNAADHVNVSYENETDTYVITVINPKLLRVTVKKAIIHNYGSNSFLFTATLMDSENTPIEMSNVYGIQGTGADGKLEFTLVNNQTALLYVPRNAKLTISETLDTWYDTVVQTGSDSEHLGGTQSTTSVEFNSITDDQFALFTNTRKMIDVTVNKTVVGPGGEFTFKATVKNGNYVMTTYTGENEFTSGEKTFTLNPMENGTETITLIIPAGSVLELNETGLPTSPQYFTTATGKKDSDQSAVGTYNSDSRVITLAASETTENVTVTFINTQGAKLAIIKNVTGDFGDTGKPFTFTVTGLSSGESYPFRKYATTDGSTWNEISGDDGTLTNSSNTFTLTHHQKIEIESLPLANALTITETNDSYTTTWTSESATATLSNANTPAVTITLTGNAVVNVTNNLNAVAPTGYNTGILPFAIMLMVGLLLGGGIILHGRRKKEDR